MIQLTLFDLVVEHTTYQCLDCLRVKFSIYGDWRYCEVRLPYAEEDLCAICAQTRYDRQRRHRGYD